MGILKASIKPCHTKNTSYSPPDVTSGEEKKLKKSLYIPPFFKGGEIRGGFKSKDKYYPKKILLNLLRRYVRFLQLQCKIRNL
jgi:hypothetical protein